MRKAGRFLWWPRVPCIRQSEPLGFCASLRDLAGATWTRRVLRLPQGFVVVDQVHASAAADGCELRWHGRTRAGLERLSVVCSESSAETWISADTQTGQGFFAPRYGRREPSWTRRLTAAGRTVTFVTALGCAIDLRPDAVWVDGLPYPL